MEIMGDVLRVIQEGSTRPTQIMHGANLTWPPLMVYLEVLIRNRLLTRASSGNRSTYALTLKGEALLGLYQKLKSETAILEMEAAADGRLAEFSRPRLSGSTRKAMATLRRSLASANFRAVEGDVSGRSGARYSIPLVVQGTSGARYGFISADAVSESTVIENFVKQMDTEVDMVIVHSGLASEEARHVASLDSISLVPTSDLAGFHEGLAFRDAFRSSKSVVLEVDPQDNYERAIEDLVRRMVETWDVSVLTWKESRIGGVIEGLVDDVHIVRASKAASLASSFVDMMRRPSGTGRGRLFLFDDFALLADKVGHPRAKSLARKAVENTAQVSNRRTLFLVRRGAWVSKLGLQDAGCEKSLVYDRRGLRLWEPGQSNAPLD